MPRKPNPRGAGQRQPTEAELALLETALRGAKPLPGRALRARRERADPVILERTPVAPPVRSQTAEIRTRPAILPPLEAGAASGVDAQTMRRLKRGEIRVEDGIDLHGKTLDLAHAAVNRFIARAHASGKRCVLIVTGHGGGRGGAGVLRAEVPRWLNESALRSLVLGFSAAQPRDGGIGALYVLLRKKRDQVRPAGPVTG